MANQRVFLGLASGWAADGIDTAMVRTAGRGERMKVVPLCHTHLPLDSALSERVRAAWNDLPTNRDSLALAQLDCDLAGEFARAAEASIEQSGVERGQIVAVGASQQIVARLSGKEGRSPRHVVLLGHPAMIAEQIRLPVVAGFAASDLATGGCGGPVEAWPDWLMFHHRRLSRVVVRLSGVISISFIPAGGLPADVLAFDTAPGSVLLDAIARKLFHVPLDADGAIAAGGKVCGPLLNELLAADHFHAPPPKLTSADCWSDAYLARLMMQAGRHNCQQADLMATASEMIARSVVDAIASLTERPHEVVLGGGAARNIHLAGRIRQLMSPSSTYSIEHYDDGLSAYGAVCQAVLAAARVDGLAAHCPQATGATRAAVLGAVRGA